MARAHGELRNIPGPAPSRVWGWRSSLAAFRRDPLGYVQQLHRQYGDVVAFAGGPAPVIAVARPDAAEALFEAALFRSVAFPVEPVAMLFQEQLRTCHNHTQRIVQHTLDRWGVGQVVDVVYVIRQVMLRSTLAAFFDADLPSDVLLTLDGWLRAWWYAVFSPASIGVVSRSSTEMTPGVPRKLRAFFTDLVAAAPQSPGARLFAPGDAVDGAVALVALLGEMTALAVGWTLLLEGQHVAVADDLAAELRTVLAGAPPTFEQAMRSEPLVLLDGVVRESLRMLPPLGVATRIARNAWHLAPYDVPAGATIVYSPYLLQRAPNLYYAPDRFRPQRWSQIEPGPQAFLPLGVEPLPQLLLPPVIMQAKLITAMILQRYQMVPVAGSRINAARSLMLAPSVDIPLVIAPVDRAIERRVVSGTIRALVQFP